MIAEIIREGDKLELIPFRQNMNEDNAQRKVYKSQVYEVVSEDELLIAMPIEQGRIVLLHIDSVYDMYFFCNTGFYHCRGKIVDRYKSNNIFILSISLISSLEKEQRREHYRLKCYYKVRYRELSEAELALADTADIIRQELELEMPVVYTEGHGADISGGGARFISSQKENSDKQILMLITAETEYDSRRFCLQGRVLSSVKLENRELVQYEHRVQFEKIKKEERERIIRYVFEEERRIRKKEKG